MKRAGLSTLRSTQRRYTDVQKSKFLRRLATAENVSAVARELGLNRMTCYVWVHKAGILNLAARTPRADLVATPVHRLCALAAPG